MLLSMVSLFFNKSCFCKILIFQKKNENITKEKEELNQEKETLLKEIEEFKSGTDSTCPIFFLDCFGILICSNF